MDCGRGKLAIFNGHHGGSSRASRKKDAIALESARSVEGD